MEVHLVFSQVDVNKKFQINQENPVTILEKVARSSAKVIDGPKKLLGRIISPPPNLEVKLFMGKIISPPPTLEAKLPN
jgi:hypothetical protein